jgi:hypothetical protein
MITYADDVAALEAKIRELLIGLNDLNLAVALCCRAQLAALAATAPAAYTEQEAADYDEHDYAFALAFDPDDQPHPLDAWEGDEWAAYDEVLRDADDDARDERDATITGIIADLVEDGISLDEAEAVAGDVYAYALDWDHDAFLAEHIQTLAAEQTPLALPFAAGDLVRIVLPGLPITGLVGKVQGLDEARGWAVELYIDEGRCTVYALDHEIERLERAEAQAWRCDCARALGVRGPLSIMRCGPRLTLGDGSIWEEQGDGRIIAVAAPTSLAAALMPARAAALWGTPL